MTNEFTLEGYENLIIKLLDKGYLVSEFENLQAEKPNLILRHDVDMSLQAALKVAKVEKKIGVRSTYFILLRSEMYNTFSKISIDAIREIHDCGHRIGLHFDASLYSSDYDVLREEIEKEINILESIIKKTVNIVSYHRPSKELLENNYSFDKFEHAYQEKYWKDIGYCSDSRGNWYHGHPLANSSVEQGKALQLLTHPIWWHTPTDECVQEKLEKFCMSRLQLLQNELASNCKTYVVNNNLNKYK